MLHKFSAPLNLLNTIKTFFIFVSHDFSSTNEILLGVLGSVAALYSRVPGSNAGGIKGFSDHLSHNKAFLKSLYI